MAASKKPLTSSTPFLKLVLNGRPDMSANTTLLTSASQRFGIGQLFVADSRKHPIDHVGPNLTFERVKAPVPYVLQRQHPRRNFGRRCFPPSRRALWPPSA